MYWETTKFEGVDYNETFALVARVVIERCILTLAISKGWSLHQMDIHNAFLHGDLHEDIYMKPPLGFSPLAPNLVSKLKNSLYSLRQAPRQWYFKLATVLHDYGFEQSPLDHSLFVYNQGNVFLALLIYVNDSVLTNNSSSHCSSFKTYLNKCFKLKELGPLKYFVGIEFARSLQGHFLCQRKYT